MYWETAHHKISMLIHLGQGSGQSPWVTAASCISCRKVSVSTHALAVQLQNLEAQEDLHAWQASTAGPADQVTNSVHERWDNRKESLRCVAMQLEPNLGHVGPALHPCLCKLLS